MADLPGGCLCGAVRYRMHRAPLSAGICHCVTCRRAAGAGSVAWATLPKADFEMTGEMAVHASSPGILRGFCPTCGTSLTFDDGSETIDVTLASLDDPEAVRPTKEIWLDHRVSWVATDPDLEHRPRGE